MKALVVVVLLLASIHASASGDEHSNDQNYTDADLDASPSFQTGGGAIHLSVKGGKNIELRWAVLAEVDPNGQIVKSLDLTTKNYLWSQLEHRDYEDDKGRSSGQQFPSSNFSIQLSNGAWFNVSAWVVTTDFTFGNITGQKNAVKFNIYISNWTFANSSDTLEVIADVNGHGGDDHGSADTNDDDKNQTGYDGYHAAWKQYQLKYAIGYVTSPNQATYDGGNTGPVNVTYTTNGKPTVTWSFLSFQSNVSYDPLVGTNSGLQVAPSLLLLVLSFLALFGGK